MKLRATGTGDMGSKKGTLLRVESMELFWLRFGHSSRAIHLEINEMEQ